MLRRVEYEIPSHELVKKCPELDGKFLFTDAARRSVLIDIELLRVWGASNQKIIELFNASQKGIK